MSAAITIENLGKRYRVQQPQERASYVALRDILAARMRAPLRWVTRPPRRPDSYADVFWALKHVSLDVKQGDVLGIVGPNGAGKSTLLKILSRITEPTEGRATLDGRVSSLL